MSKFRFKSNKKKNKFNFVTDNSEFLNQQIIMGSHIELFSNEKLILEGCSSILDYQSEYIKLKLKKGFIIIMGNDFLISSFEEKKICIKGKIFSIEFTV